ncbi:hypothetical protein C2845_PM06G13890 [Panicum miliaceum]|uniref:Uncharacterized protein n=1 Tax=Panicum miliaceum TaxID=4540 RepID=A0A3L6RFB1_PANMI|nr:hypothetical protein C2845_PM06G13890 [Panicum miliaceum]
MTPPPRKTTLYSAAAVAANKKAGKGFPPEHPKSQTWQARTQPGKIRPQSRKTLSGQRRRRVTSRRAALGLRARPLAPPSAAHAASRARRRHLAPPSAVATRSRRFTPPSTRAVPPPLPESAGPAAIEAAAPPSSSQATPGHPDSPPQAASAPAGCRCALRRSCDDDNSSGPAASSRSLDEHTQPHDVDRRSCSSSAPAAAATRRATSAATGDKSGPAAIGSGR